MIINALLCNRSNDVAQAESWTSAIPLVDQNRAAAEAFSYDVIRSGSLVKRNPKGEPIVFGRRVAKRMSTIVLEFQQHINITKSAERRESNADEAAPFSAIVSVVIRPSMFTSRAADLRIQSSQHTHLNPALIVHQVRAGRRRARAVDSSSPPRGSSARAPPILLRRRITRAAENGAAAPPCGRNAASGFRLERIASADGRLTVNSKSTVSRNYDAGNNGNSGACHPHLYATAVSRRRRHTEAGRKQTSFAVRLNVSYGRTSLRKKSVLLC
jgi:hypothetical protein